VAKVATDCAHWLIKIQNPDGSIQAGYIGMNLPGCIFNTGMVLEGWVKAYERTKEPLFLQAAQKAAEWLCQSMDDDGCWRRNLSHYVDPAPFNTYNVLVSWALMRFALIANHQPSQIAAEKNLRWTLEQANSRGFFACCEMAGFKHPITHSIAYTLQGVLEVGLLLNSSQAVDLVLRALKELAGRQRPSGGYAGIFTPEWQEAVEWECLNGSAQLTILMYRAFEQTKNEIFLNSFEKGIQWLIANQVSAPNVKEVHGGLFGSFPIYGAYHTYSLPNSAAKYLLDALMLKKKAPTSKRLLVISYRFPPQNVGGCIRAIKFIKYLARRGWNVDVVVPQGSTKQGFEEDLADSKITIFPVYCWHPLETLQKIKKKWISHRSKASEISGKSNQKTRTSWYVRCLIWLLQFPDESKFWGRPLKSAIDKYFKRFPECQAIFMHGAPFSHFKAVAIGNLLWRRRLIIDYRDPWISGLNLAYPFERLKPKIIKEERFVLQSASAITSVTKGYVDYLKKSVAPSVENHFHIIRNGFDLEDFNFDTFLRPPRRFIMAHTGALAGRRADYFFAGLELFLQNNPNVATQCELNFYGPKEIAIVEKLQQYQLKDLKIQWQQLPHNQLVNCLPEVAVFLLFLTQGFIDAISVAGKFYEYLAMRRPILAFGLDGETRQLLEQCQGGRYFVGKIDPQVVASQLEQYYQLWQAGNLIPFGNPELHQQFSRQNLTIELEKLFLPEKSLSKEMR
jgi:hypothetical protein